MPLSRPKGCCPDSEDRSLVPNPLRVLHPIFVLLHFIITVVGA